MLYNRHKSNINGIKIIPLIQKILTLKEKNTLPMIIRSYWIILKTKKEVSKINNKILFESKSELFTKIIVYKNKIALEQLFGEKTMIPFSNISTIKKTITGIVIYPNNGKKTNMLFPWRIKKRKEFYELISKLIGDNK